MFARKAAQFPARTYQAELCAADAPCPTAQRRRRIRGGQSSSQLWHGAPAPPQAARPRSLPRRLAMILTHLTRAVAHVASGPMAVHGRSALWNTEPAKG